MEASKVLVVRHVKNATKNNFAMQSTSQINGIQHKSSSSLEQQQRERPRWW
jgi:hypothetical protein